MQVPAYVEYEKATSVAHALALLERFGPEARILAGGHSLIPMMKLRLAQPETLIDINALTELAYITVTGPVGSAGLGAGRRAGAGGSGGSPPGERSGGSPPRASTELRIGAMTRHAQLLDSAEAAQHFAVLHDAEQVIADPVVRNWGTVGGSLCQADPSEDLSAAFAALKATMVIAGPEGTRTVPARDFHTGPYETVVAPGEILTEIRITIRPGGGSAYEKVGRRAGDWPVGAVGSALWLDNSGPGNSGPDGSRPASRGLAGGGLAGGGPASGTIADAGIGLTAVGAPHFSAADAEDFLRGAPATEESFARAGELAAASCHPVSDQRGPADYKRHLARELTIRSLRRALARARQQSAG